MSMSYHPQMDGQTEQANHNVGQIFCTVIQPDQKDWVDWIDLTEFALTQVCQGPLDMHCLS